MIATPRPGSNHYRLLALVVAYPGELGTAELAAHLWPPVKEGPPSSLADLYARRKARKEDQKAAEAKVWRMIGQMVEKGLICACGPPVLSGWFQERLSERKRVENGREVTVRAQTVAEAIRRASPEYPGKVGPLDVHIGLVEKLRGGKVGAVADLLGKKPNGATKQVYRDLCTWGVVVPPSYRWATEAGRALVAKGGS